MIKTYCDVCQKEVKGENLITTAEYRKLKEAMVSSEGGQLQKQRREIVILICDKCQPKVEKELPI